MNQQPNATKPTVCLFGPCNAGKSSLFNALTGTNQAIVSAQPGTTTDPVIKSMELIPYGPIVLIDTAGLGDNGCGLGAKRMDKTWAMLERADVALYAADTGAPEDTQADFIRFQQECAKRRTPCLFIRTKTDQRPDNQAEISDVLSVSIYNPQSIDALKQRIGQALSELNTRQQGLLEGILAPGSVTLLIVPIDSEAPKGRLILPQVQLIRECLDNGIRCHVATVDTLPAALADLPHIDLAVTDSQAFREAADLIPAHIPLTSFSLLMARQKGDIAHFVETARTLKNLQPDDTILIAEACTHSHGHDDIGHVKIPAMLQKITGHSLQIDFAAGHDFPEPLNRYKLIIHCGGCMIGRKEMQNRIQAAQAAGVPTTNYGVVLAYANGILDRSVAPLGIHTISR